MAVTSHQTATVKPATSGAYLAASALYNAGFRGWPLTIMTAIAGRESHWRPTALNNDPSTQDYSIGLTQINDYGALDASRTSSYGSPSALSADPQAQAKATYELAGGNSLSGLGNWKLSPSPQNGTVPTPTVPGYSIYAWLAQAAVAVQQVGVMGPAPASQIANERAWPGTAGATAAEEAALPASIQAVLLSAAQGQGGGGCGTLKPVFSALGVTFTRCEAKGLLGGLAIAGGGGLMIVGLALVIVAAGKGKGPLSGVVQTASAVRGLPVIRRIGSST